MSSHRAFHSYALIGPAWFLLASCCTALAADIPAIVETKARARSPNELTEVWEPVPPLVSVSASGVPSDAIVLFDGKNLDRWEPARPDGAPWKIEDGAMVVVPSLRPCDQRTKLAFGDLQLHLEWRTPVEVKGAGQDRGNSGVFFMGLYELQILDSYKNLTYVNGQAASVYKEHAPLVNVSKPPGAWQTYDAVFVAPRFSDGKVARPARITAFHNGVLVLNNVALTGPTPNGPTFNLPQLPPYEAHAEKLPLLLQDHRSPVAYRNIWVRELHLPE